MATETETGSEAGVTTNVEGVGDATGGSSFEDLLDFAETVPSLVEEGKGSEEAGDEGFKGAEGTSEKTTATNQSGTDSDDAGTNADSQNDSGAADADPADSQPTELEELMAQNKALLARLNQLEELALGNVSKQAAEQNQDQNQGVKTDNLSDSVPSADTSAKGILEELGVTDLDDVTTDAVTFEKVLQHVVQRAEKNAVERILKAVPQIVSNGVNSAITTKRVVDSFYEENQELTQAKKTVAVLTNEVLAEHPDWTLENVLGEAGNRTRVLLGLKKRAVANSGGSNNSEDGSGDGSSAQGAPAFAGSTGARGGKQRPSLSKMQQGVNDLLDS